MRIEYDKSKMGCFYCDNKEMGGGRLDNSSYYDNRFTGESKKNGKELENKRIYYPIIGYFKEINIEQLREDYPEISIIRLIKCKKCSKKFWLLYIPGTETGYSEVEYEFFKQYEYEK